MPKNVLKINEYWGNKYKKHGLNRFYFYAYKLEEYTGIKIDGKIWYDYDTDEINVKDVCISIEKLDKVRKFIREKCSNKRIID